jgi:hypothetical protein
MITNADRGILFTWWDDEMDGQWHTRMALITDGIPSVVKAPQVPDGGQVFPVLQAQDGSFFGTGGGNILAFEANGNVRWTVPNDNPQIATADGGVIGQSGIVYDQDGRATGMMNLAAPSWTGQAYSLFSGAIADVVQAPPPYASSFGTVAGGNLSESLTFVPFLAWIEGIPVFGGGRGPKCELGTDKPNLSGDALAAYHAAKESLLGGNYLTSQACSDFFAMEGISNYFGQLTSAVTNLAPFDGLQTTISMYDAGLWDHTVINQRTFPAQWQQTPVCASITAATVAEAQVQKPATDVYINSRKNVWKNYLTQSTLLHEALHGLTGLNDPGLAETLGTSLTATGATYPINQVLVRNGCAAN